ncbi:uncharacterized protein LOC123010623 [Tribolium madens]|uniref:uncharacterized protein LOC123010623 n=1 Tax=Tribolium madens TaxID=41895 RepID=UPI001CF734B4|nr:uncharacterized protein LOC123010623 [Tribolium madens]
MLVKVLPFFTFFLAICSAKVTPKVKCTPELMRVEIPISSSTKRVYLGSLRDYPDPACRPYTDPSGTLAVLELNLTDVYRCAVTRVVNKQTGKQIYYQTLVIESLENVEGVSKEIQETLHVKCSLFSSRNHSITRRDVLPAGFQEAEDADLQFMNISESRAPDPILGVGVRQAGKLVTGELNVSPGTPLQMEIFLDKASAPIYGLLVTHMQVTDTNVQEETIIYNGCSVDPYLFENFNTVDGDFLAAKFRAFKFPESTYVQFKGTVNVCLDKCKGVECSDGQIGYGRKRRAISSNPSSPNGLFEITITSFIKVDYEEGSENLKDLIENQTVMYNNKMLIVGNQMTDNRRFYKTVDDNNLKSLESKEERSYTSIVAENSSSARNFDLALISLLVLFRLFL